MNFENKLARLMRNTGPARFFIPVGIVLIIFGAILFGMKTDSFEKTVGKITSVTEEINEEKQIQYDLGITYTVNGKTYENTFENLSGKFKVGDDIDVYYNPENPESITNSKIGGFVAPAMIALGAVAVVFGVAKTAKAIKKSKELDQSVPGGTARADFDGFRKEPGVTEYYCRFDGDSLRPGYVIEDAARRVLYEGKMTKNALVGARIFEFRDCVSGLTTEHEVGHTMTQTYNEEFLSARSWFKVDGKNIWDLLHERGLRLATDMRSKFPRLIYQATRDGEAFALIETASQYVHEEDEAQHKINIPVGRYYYRIWTNSDDFETLFLTVFAISETEQAMVE